MSTFDTPVQPVDPNRYLSSFSQGTEKASLQPLAEVPKLSEKYVSPDYKANTSAGKALEGVGEIEKSDISLVDNVIKTNIDDKLNAGINKIRDSFGVAQAADIENGVASAVGRGGAEGVPLSLDPQQGGAGTPLQLTKLGNRIDGLTEAYKQGDLSNSAYYAKMEAFVRQVKQQAPGYSDDVDEMVKTKLGVNPANAVRTAIQQDVTELQKKVQAQNDKWTTYENSNSQYIHTVWPNYESLKQNGQAPSPEEVKSKVGNLQARDYQTTARIQALGLVKSENSAIADRAEEIVASKASDLAGHLTVGATNTMGIKNASDLQQLLNDVRTNKRAPLSPEEKDTVTGIFATMKQTYGVQFDRFVNQNVDPQTGQTMAPLTTRMSPEKITAQRTLGMTAITDMENGLVNQQYGILTQSANYNKARIDAAEGDFLRTAPVAGAIAAGRKFFGDQGIMTLIAGTPMLQSVQLEAFRQYNLGKMAQGDSSLRSVFDDYNREKINDAKLNRAAISDGVTAILHSDKMDDKGAGAAAVKHVYGPDNRTLINAFDDKNQVQVFTDLVSPTIAKKIEKMDKTSQSYFFNFANEGFTTVYEGQVANANKAADAYKTSNNLAVQYNPETQNFAFKSTNMIPGYGNAGIVNAANSQLTGLNTAINAMKDVFKLEGKDPTQELYTLLPAAGIQPGSPIYKALQTEILKLEKKDTKDG